MGFRMFCNVKGCYKEMEPVLDKETNDVYCIECNSVINNITEFAKTQMKSIGQIKKNTTTKKAFSVQCSNCKKEGTPILNDNKLLCMFCNVECKNISKPFASSLKEMLSKASG